MTTNAPGLTLPARSIPGVDADGQVERLVESALRWLQQFVCGLHGHETILQYERARIYLKCTSCGRESPGWEIAAHAPLSRQRTDMVSRRPSAPDLAVFRRIA